MFGVSERVGRTIREYPRTFWALAGATFIDTVGATLLFPFFALYVTWRFGVGMTEAGLILGTFSLAGIAGSAVGGALTDRFGRRRIVLFGLIFSAVSALAMGFAAEIAIFYPLAVVVGLLGSLADPARHAMIADILPEEQRAEGFGLMRVIANLAWIIGPAIGGLVASYSFIMLFVLDTIASLLTALVVYRLVPETMPQRAPGQQPQTMVQTFVGYRLVAADAVFMAFLFATVLQLLAYQQLTNTVSVYLRDVHGIPAQGYGLLISVNAIMVVLLQFWVTRRIKSGPPMLMMVAGTGFFLVGFTMIGIVAGFEMFLLAAIIITVGEMIVVPVSQAMVAQLAPAHMRGRYMAVWGFGWAIPSAIGPLGAGLIMDNLNPNLVWYAAGLLCALAMAGYYLLHMKARERLTQPAATTAA